jgi:hypothetical protein
MAKKKASKPKKVKPELQITPVYDTLMPTRFKAICSVCSSDQIKMEPITEQQQAPFTIEFKDQSLPDSFGQWRRFQNKATMVVVVGFMGDLLYYPVSVDGHMDPNPRPVSELPKGGWWKAQFEGD